MHRDVEKNNNCSVKTSSPLHCTVVKSGVHSVIRALPAGQTSNRTLHAEFCRFILYVHRNTPTNACTAELGIYPLIIYIHKRTLNFFYHLKSNSETPSTPKPSKLRAEPRTESTVSAGTEANCPLRQSDQPHNNTALQTPIRVKLIITQCKET